MEKETKDYDTAKEQRERWVATVIVSLLMVFWLLLKTGGKNNTNQLGNLDKETITKIIKQFHKIHTQDDKTIYTGLADLQKAWQNIHDDPILYALYKKRTNDKEMVGGIELCLALVESRCERDAVSWSGATGKLQITSGAKQSLNKDIIGLKKEYSQEQRESASEKLNNKDIVGLLYFAKQYYKCSKIINDWKIMTPQERYAITYLSYNMGYYRRETLVHKFNINNRKDFLVFASKQISIPLQNNKQTIQKLMKKYPTLSKKVTIQCGGEHTLSQKKLGESTLGALKITFYSDVQ